LKTDAFDYDLPERLIAQRPTELPLTLLDFADRRRMLFGNILAHLRFLSVNEVRSVG